MSDEIRLSATTVNAPDALALAIFYAELTGGDTLGSEHWATVSGPNGFIAFQQVDDFCPPVWPGADVPMQMHLDFFVDDLGQLEPAQSLLVPPGSTSSRTPTTAWCTPTRPAILSACPPGTGRTWTTSPTSRRRQHKSRQTVIGPSALDGDRCVRSEVRR